MPTLQADFPAKLQFLFKPARYKILHGGRGGAKSWGAARALLILAAKQPLRVLCAREFQKSMADSVHQLLKDQIEALGLDELYRIRETYIEGVNGSLFTFHGLKHNVKNIKSIEGTDICWVEEAQTVSRSSWNTLIPTIRREGSEIWITFNPELESDETYQRFVKSPPTGATVVKMNWSDNPWFPAVSRQEMEDLKARDEDEYLTVWEGHCRQALDGAIFANEIRLATTENRFTRVPYEESKPVTTFWDLGRADMTAIWFVQQIGFEFRLIDYYQNQGFALRHYLKILAEKPYVFDEHWLPHDAENELMASDLTIQQQMKAAGHKVKITAKISIADGINAARAVFSKCWFDADKCEDGINALRHYRYDVDADTQEYSRAPLHDVYSHGADAFRYMAVSLKVGAKSSRKPLTTNSKWVI
jgi:phage terminase large subunit